MWRVGCVLLCCSIAVAADQKPQTPKQIREAKEKAIKEKMAPTEKKLDENKEDLAIAKAAPIGKAGGSKLVNGGRHQWTGFRTAEKKKEICDQYEAEIKKLTEQLAPLKAELEALKKQPPPKADEKPKPPEKPEAKP